MIDKLLKLVISAFLIFIMILMWFSFNKVEVEERPTKYEVTKFCQEISATANDNWNYKSCIEELEKSLKEGLLGEVKRL